MTLLRLSIFLIALWLSSSSPALAQQIAAGDSVLYNGGRYQVEFLSGQPIFSDDADFVKRLSPVVVHIQSRLKLVSWCDPGTFEHKDVMPPDDPSVRLQKTFAEIAAATKTTGLVLYRDGDTAPQVDIPAEDVEKIE